MALLNKGGARPEAEMRHWGSGDGKPGRIRPSVWIAVRGAGMAYTSSPASAQSPRVVGSTHGRRAMDDARPAQYLFQRRRHQAGIVNQHAALVWMEFERYEGVRQSFAVVS